ncbi:MAG: hypothetical protein H6712_31860 [Myxococcales bacterium]|nr:hypothetical protein [Myxococcales bacterium]MCB9718489.1 hypothetical protein [Myxococcales bacterium]
MDLLPTMAMGIASGVIATLLTLILPVMIYLLLLYDSRRKDSPAAGDDQLGLKTVGVVLILFATALFTAGLQKLLETLLTFDDVGDNLKDALPLLVVGILGVLGTSFMLFPKTNAAEFPKAKRLAAGIVALVTGMALLPVLTMFLDELLDWDSWKKVASALSVVVDITVVFGISFMTLGRLSGMKMPEKVATVAQPVGQPAAAPGQAYAGQPQAYPGQPQGYPQAQPQQPYPQGQPQQPYSPQQPPGPGGWPQG